MHKYLLDYLACPICHAELDWSIQADGEARIFEAEARCTQCDEQFPVKDGIAIFLTDKLTRNDTWAEVESGLAKYLRQNPELEQQLIESSIEHINAADQFFRAMILEERGNFIEARSIAQNALQGIYVPDYLNIQEGQRQYLVEQIEGIEKPIVDIASGRGYLVEALLKAGHQQVVASDFSPTVLRRNRAYYEYLGLYDGLSLIACDARMMPFKAHSIPTMTSFVGLGNIEQADTVLQELSRIVSGRFWSVSEFYPDNGDDNARMIREHGLDGLMFEARVLENFARSNWQVEIENRQTVHIEPTPVSEILGFGIDGLPVKATEIVSCVIVAGRA